MKELEPQELHALVDGELPPDQQARVLEALRHDPELAREVCELRQLKAQLQAAYPLEATSRQERPSTASRIGVAAAIVLAMLISGISGWQLRHAAEPERLVVLDSQGRAQAPATAQSEETRIVVHLTEDDMAAAGELLNEVEGLLAAYQQDGAPLRVEIVSHGKGLALLREGLSTHKQRIQQLSQRYRNLTFVACLNTMERLRVEKGIEVQLVPEAEVTRAGIARVLKRRREGWTYIKA
jgi:intracellular sulfur oxidation DsrE/DsrF family protein